MTGPPLPVARSTTASPNIDAAAYVYGHLSVRVGCVRRLLRELVGKLPEDNFLENLELTDDDENFLTIESPTWCGVGSGRSYEVLREVLAETVGEALIAFVREGATVTGLRVDGDGVASRKIVFCDDGPDED